METGKGGKVIILSQPKTCFFTVNVAVVSSGGIVTLPPLPIDTT